LQQDNGEAVVEARYLGITEVDFCRGVSGQQKRPGDHYGTNELLHEISRDMRESQLYIACIAGSYGEGRVPAWTG
jgi:hypothetical protein